MGEKAHWSNFREKSGMGCRISGVTEKRVLDYAEQSGFVPNRVNVIWRISASC